MDSNNILFTLVVIALIAFPFIYMYWNSLQKAKKIKKSFFQHAGEQGYTIGNFEIFGDWVIGLDEAKRIFGYYKKDKTKDISTYVNLSEMSGCTVQKIQKTIFNNNASLEVIEKIGFVFKPHDKSRPDTIISIFNLEEDMQLSGELQFAEKWVKTIQKVIKG